MPGPGEGLLRGFWTHQNNSKYIFVLVHGAYDLVFLHPRIDKLLLRPGWSTSTSTSQFEIPVICFQRLSVWVNISLSGPLAFSDSGILPLGLGPETFETRSRRAGF